MRSKEFILEAALNSCPFPNSKVQSILYHGTTADFTEFARVAHGIYVTPVKSWAMAHYGNKVIQLYANVIKLKTLDYTIPEDDNIIDLFYDRDYTAISRLLAGWSNDGYNCCLFGGESDSMVLFGDIEIVNAVTGNRM